MAKVASDRRIPRQSLVHSLARIWEGPARDELRKIAVPVEHEKCLSDWDPSGCSCAVCFHHSRAETKVQVSDDLPFDRFSLLLCESSSCNAGQDRADQASAPIYDVHFMAVLPKICCCVIAVESIIRSLRGPLSYTFCRKNI